MKYLKLKAEPYPLAVIKGVVTLSILTFTADDGQEYILIFTAEDATDYITVGLL